MFPLQLLVLSFIFHVCSVMGDKMVFETFTYKEAQLKCCQENPSSSLMQIVNLQVYQQAVKSLERRNLSETWHDLRKVRSANFTWLNGEIPGNDYITDQWERRRLDCIMYHFRDRGFQGEPCNKRHGYMCSKQSCSECNQLGKVSNEHSCIQINQTCLVLYCGSWSWYQAAAECEHFGLELAILQELDGIKLIQNFKGFHTNCDLAWVGLSRAKWIIPLNGSGLLPKTIFWMKEEPSPHHDCSIIQKGPNGYTWKAVSCDSKYPVLCSAKMYQRTTMSTDVFLSQDIRSASTQHLPTTMDTQNPGFPVSFKAEEQFGLLIAITIICALTFLLVVIYMIICTYKKKLNRKKSSRQRDEEIHMRDIEHE